MRGVGVQFPDVDIGTVPGVVAEFGPLPTIPTALQPLGPEGTPDIMGLWIGLTPMGKPP